MKDSLRGGILVSVILFGILVYYFIWVYQPAEPVTAENGDENGGVTAVNYLNFTPNIPDDRAVEIGGPAPDFAYLTIDGREFRLSDYFGVKPVVIDVWATTCPPCMLELPVLQELYDEYSDRVEIVAVTSERRQSASQVARVVRDKNLTFPVIHDPSGAIVSIYPTRYIPYLVFITRDGMAIEEHSGYSESIKQQIIDILDLE